MSTDILISIDPGKDTGFSAWVNGKLYHSTLIDGTTSTHLVKLLHKLFNNLKNELNTVDFNKVALIEDGFVGPNKKSALSLAQKRGVAQAVFEQFDFNTIKWIYPSTWQKGLFKDKTEGNVKKWSIDLACKIADLSKINTNIADSICIAFYYLHYMQL